MLLLSPMTSYKPYFHSFYKRAPITQPLVSKSELASPLPPHREQFTSQVLITRSDTQKLELANLVLHLQLFSSVQFSRSVASDSLRPHESQHARPPCPSPTPEPNTYYVLRVGDTIQQSQFLSSPSPPAFNPYQHQNLFQ